MDVSLRQHLEKLGWDDQFLNKTGRFARIGLKNGSPCLEPYSRLQRILTSRRLPIVQIIPPGTQVKFLKSLKHELLGSGPRFSLYRLLLSIVSFFSHQDLSKVSAFEGLIEEQSRFDQFPFDEWLTVIMVSDFDASYTLHDGQVWTISHLALTEVTQIEIRQ